MGATRRLCSLLLLTSFLAACGTPGQRAIILSTAADGSRLVCAEPASLPADRLSPALTLGHGAGFLACRGHQTGRLDRDAHDKALRAVPRLIVAAAAQDRATARLGREARITLALQPWRPLCEVADAERARQPPWRDAGRVADACWTLLRPALVASAGEPR